MLIWTWNVKCYEKSFKNSIRRPNNWWTISPHSAPTHLWRNSFFTRSEVEQSLFDAFCDWLALFECFGFSPSFLLHYPILRQKALTELGRQSRHSFIHFCSHWEGTVIKLLIAWTFLCVFTRHVKKRSGGCKSQPSCGS